MALEEPASRPHAWHRLNKTPDGRRWQEIEHEGRRPEVSFGTCPKQVKALLEPTLQVSLLCTGVSKPTEGADPQSCALRAICSGEIGTRRSHSRIPESECEWHLRPEMDRHTAKQTSGASGPADRGGGGGAQRKGWGEEGALNLSIREGHRAALCTFE